MGSTSPFVDAGIAGITTDQTGATRLGLPDLGAYEFGTPGAGCACVTTAPSDATIVWLGCVSSDWQDGANWSTNATPQVTDIVYIPTGTSNDLIINEVATCAKFVQQIGAVVKVNYNAGGKLVVKF